MKSILRKLKKSAVISVLFAVIVSAPVYAASSDSQNLRYGYNFGFFASLFLIIILSTLLFYLKNKTTKNKN